MPGSSERYESRAPRKSARGSQKDHVKPCASVGSGGCTLGSVSRSTEDARSVGVAGVLVLDGGMVVDGFC